MWSRASVRFSARIRSRFVCNPPPSTNGSKHKDDMSQDEDEDDEDEDGHPDEVGLVVGAGDVSRLQGQHGAGGHEQRDVGQAHVQVPVVEPTRQPHLLPQPVPLLQPKPRVVRVAGRPHVEHGHDGDQPRREHELVAVLDEAQPLIARKDAVDAQRLEHERRVHQREGHVEEDVEGATRSLGGLQEGQQDGHVPQQQAAQHDVRQLQRHGFDHAESSVLVKEGRPRHTQGEAHQRRGAQRQAVHVRPTEPLGRNGHARLSRHRVGSVVDRARFAPRLPWQYPFVVRTYAAFKATPE